MRRNQNEYVQLFYERVKLKRLLNKTEKAMDKFLIEEDEFFEKARKQLTEFEMTVIKEYSINEKSFQQISKELNCPYRNIRESWIVGNEKLSIIANFLDD